MAQDVDAYLKDVPVAQRASLETLRRLIVDVVPDATEIISYGMPTFKFHGKTVAHFAAFKKHCSLFPASGTIFEKFEEELKPFRTSKGTVQFTPDNELPESLVRKILEVRMSEIEAGR